MGGQNLENSRSQSVTKISPQNVSTLKQKWVFTTRGNVSATPAVHDGTVYFPDWARILLRGRCEQWRLAMVEAGGALDGRRGRLGSG